MPLTLFEVHTTHPSGRVDVRRVLGGSGNVHASEAMARAGLGAVVRVTAMRTGAAAQPARGIVAGPATRAVRDLLAARMGTFPVISGSGR